MPWSMLMSRLPEYCGPHSSEGSRKVAQESTATSRDSDQPILAPDGCLWREQTGSMEITDGQTGVFRRANSGS